MNLTLTIIVIVQYCWAVPFCFARGQKIYKNLLCVSRIQRRRNMQRFYRQSLIFVYSWITLLSRPIKIFVLKSCVDMMSLSKIKIIYLKCYLYFSFLFNLIILIKDSHKHLIGRSWSRNWGHWTYTTGNSFSPL
jgi:hypothetical protein